MNAIALAANVSSTVCTRHGEMTKLFSDVVLMLDAIEVHAQQRNARLGGPLTTTTTKTGEKEKQLARHMTRYNVPHDWLNGNTLRQSHLDKLHLPRKEFVSAATSGYMMIRMLEHVQ